MRSSALEGRGYTVRGTARDTVERAARHCRACAATRPSMRCDMTWPGPRHGVMRAQAGPRVGILFTRLSFDIVHYSESLFGTLFMNTVHEHCSRGFQK